MSTIVSITEFRNNIGTYIDRVIYREEEFLLKKGKSVVAKITKSETKKKSRNKNSGLLSLAGIWKGKEGEKIEKVLKEINEKSKADVFKHII